MNTTSSDVRLMITKITTNFCVRDYVSGIYSFFPKKNGVLAARLGARNFTRGLGYAKHPLPVLHVFADARFSRRSLTQTQAYADARFGRQAYPGKMSRAALLLLAPTYPPPLLVRRVPQDHHWHIASCI